MTRRPVVKALASLALYGCSSVQRKATVLKVVAVMYKQAPRLSFINPRRACARVTVLVLCVCVSVYPSVPALAASASVETSKQRYSRVSLRLFLD